MTSPFTMMPEKRHTQSDGHRPYEQADGEGRHVPTETRWPEDGHPPGAH